MHRTFVQGGQHTAKFITLFVKEYAVDVGGYKVIRLGQIWDQVKFALVA